MFASWIMGIVVIAALGVLLDIILPEGETEKYVKGIFSILIIFVIISPLPALLKKDWSLESVLTGGETVQIDGSFKDKLKEKEYEAAAEGLKESLTKKYAECTVQIFRDFSGGISFVIIDFSKNGISEIFGNKISVDSVKAEVSAVLGVNRELIIVYE